MFPHLENRAYHVLLTRVSTDLIKIIHKTESGTHTVRPLSVQVFFLLLQPWRLHPEVALSDRGDTGSVPRELGLRGGKFDVCLAQREGNGSALRGALSESHQH